MSIKAMNLTPLEAATVAAISEEQVWRNMEDGTWPVVALADIQYANGTQAPYDYTFIPPEVVRRIIGKTHDTISYEASHKTVFLPASRDILRVFATPELTPELYPSHDGSSATPKVWRDAAQDQTKPDTREYTAPRLVEWRRAIVTNWPGIVKEYGYAASARQVIAYLKKNDCSGCVLPEGDDTELRWRTIGGKIKSVMDKTVLNALGELEGDQIIRRKG